MRRRGATADEIHAALLVMNQRCEKPGPEANIRRIAESVARYEPERPHPQNGVPPRKSTERSERLAESPINTGENRSVEDRTVAERCPNGLGFEARILERFDEKMRELGLVGERHIARATYLVHISRLLRSPGRAVVKGDSSTGKSYAVECALRAAAPEELWVRTSASALALFYSETDFRHKTLVFYEANKLGDDDDPLARVLRTLVSEGKLRYEVTAPEKRTSVLLEKDGPVALVSTVARATLDKEIETRILSLHSDGSDEMTADVVESILVAAAGERTEPDFAEWHELDRWLTAGPHKVVVPWGPALAAFKLSGPPRLRRDVDNLLSLVRAHALLHRATREMDERGQVLATLEDYETVRLLLADALAIATDKAVRDGTRRIVEAVADLRAGGAKQVSAAAAARKAGRSKSTTHVDVGDALDRGYLVNRSQSQRFDLDVGDPLPAQEELLPSSEELAAQLNRWATVRSPFAPPTERFSPVVEPNSGDRSDRSAVFGGETPPGGDEELAKLSLAELREHFTGGTS
jgi:hypothetical protein